MDNIHFAYTVTDPNGRLIGLFFDLSDAMGAMTFWGDRYTQTKTEIVYSRDGEIGAYIRPLADMDAVMTAAQAGKEGK